MENNLINKTHQKIFPSATFQQEKQRFYQKQETNRTKEGQHTQKGTGMLKLCVRIEGEYLSKEQTLLKLLDGCNLLSIQLIPSSSKDFIKCNISKKNITRKNLDLGEHWELQFKTESDLLNSREIIQKHTDVYTIIEKDQINKSRNGEDQVEEGEEEEEEYEIIWSHQFEGNDAYASSGIDKLEEIHTEAEQKENNILSGQQKEEIPQVGQVFNQLNENKRKHSNQFEIDDNILSSNIEIDQQISSLVNCILKADSQPEQQIEKNSDDQHEQHEMLDSTQESTQILFNPEETHKRNLNSDAVEKNQYEQEYQQQQVIQERLKKEDNQQLRNLLETKKQQHQPLESVNNLKQGQLNEIKENKNSTNKNTKQDSLSCLLKNITNYSKYPIILIGIIYLCYLFQTQ